MSWKFYASDGSMKKGGGDIFSPWRTAVPLRSYFTNGDASEYILAANGSASVLTSSNASAHIFYVDPDDYISGARSAEFRLRSDVAQCSPGPGPGRDSIISLKPFTSASSGAVTLGAAVAANTHTGLLDSDQSSIESATFELTAGWYALTFQFSQAPAVTTPIGLTVALQVRQQ